MYVPSIKTYDCNMSVHRPVSAQWNGLCYGAFFDKKIIMGVIFPHVDESFLSPIFLLDA